MWMGYLGMKTTHANLTATGFPGEPNEVGYPYGGRNAGSNPAGNRKVAVA